MTSQAFSNDPAAGRTAPGSIDMHSDVKLETRALAMLQTGKAGEIVSRLPDDQLAAELSRVTRVYMDIDGTAVREGETTFDAATIEVFRRANAAGIELCVGPTGKPFAEALPLWRSLPPDVLVDVIIEKGAYRLHRLPNGEMEKRYLLASPQDEAAVATLRRAFYPDPSVAEDSSIGAKLEREFGVVIVPAGSGKHEAVLSFDVLKGGSSRDFESFSNAQRRELKVANAHLLERVLERFTQLVAEANIEGLNGPRIVHLGNGNIELAPASVEKHLAIKADLAARPSTMSAVVGDSKNDEPMLRLSRDREDVHGCLVLHRETAAPLIALVDTVVTGEANVAAFIERILASKVSDSRAPR